MTPLLKLKSVLGWMWRHKFLTVLAALLTTSVTVPVVLAVLFVSMVYLPVKPVQLQCYDEDADEARAYSPFMSPAMISEAYAILIAKSFGSSPDGPHIVMFGLLLRPPGEDMTPSHVRADSRRIAYAVARDYAGRDPESELARIVAPWQWFGQYPGSREEVNRASCALIDAVFAYEDARGLR